MEVGLQSSLLRVSSRSYAVSNSVASGWRDHGSVSVLVDSGGDPRSPGVVETPFAISLAQGLVASILCKVPIHVYPGVLGVWPACSGIEILLLEFPGSGSVGTEDFSVPV